MPEKTRELRHLFAKEVFRRAGLAAERYRKALKSDIGVAREAYEDLIKLLQPLYRSSSKKEVVGFLRNTKGMPVRAILKRLAE